MECQLEITEIETKADDSKDWLSTRELQTGKGEKKLRAYRQPMRVE